jgi:hypothetical protein
MVKLTSRQYDDWSIFTSGCAAAWATDNTRGVVEYHEPGREKERKSKESL